MNFRLAVLPDFPEEGWPSMDRCADMLLAHLPADVAAERCVPRFRRAFGRALGRTGYNADRLLNRFVTFPGFARRLAGRFDAFHVVDHTYAQLVHALPAGRTGVYCHDLDAFRCLVEPAKDPRPRWFRALARRILTGMQKAAVVFHNSQQTRDELVRFGLIDPARLVHAPLGVAPEFTPDPPGPVAVPWLDAVAGRPWVLHVGSCIPRKRIDVLLDVVAAARARLPELMLVKVGGEWAPAQREQIDRLGLTGAVIHTTASNAELAEAYRRAGAVLVPSEAEGFGLPVIEGLACGAAVVASDLPALREAGGPAAVFAPVADVPAWADAVTRVLTDPAAAPPRANRLAWAKQFTWDSHAETIASTYRRCFSFSPLPSGERGTGTMRLTFLNPVGVIGGGERVLLAAVRQVRRLRPDWPVSAVLAGDGPLAPALAALGAEVVVSPLPAAFAGAGDTQLRSGGAGKLLGLARRAAAAGPAGWGYLRRLRGDLRRLRPDVIHSNGLKTHFLAALARPPGAAIVWHLHDFYSHRPLARRLVGRLRRGVAAAVAISDAVKRDAEPLLPGVPVRVVRNAVDTDHFTPADRDGCELDRLAGLPPASGVVRVGLVATYANWKGQDVFLDALARVEGVHGYVVGGPIYATAGSQFTRDELEARADRPGLRGRVGFIPFQTDPADVYRMLDVVVHASTRAEPFGLTIIEAMACGRAVVVAAAGGAAELFAEGIDGLGHTPGDVAGLADAIRRLAGDAGLRQRLGENARRTAVERFAEDRFGRELIAVYESL